MSNASESFDEEVCDLHTHTHTGVHPPTCRPTRVVCAQQDINLAEEWGEEIWGGSPSMDLEMTEY